jgi:hypothetical protein
MKCCICKKEIIAKGTWQEDNNAMPVKKGRCCNECNMNIVLPARRNNLKKK